MKINIKKTHKNAVIPKYANPGDAGLDLTIVSYERIDNDHIKYNFGLAFEIPKGYVGLLFPRSSIYKQGQLLSNSCGVLDSSYRGEVSAVMLGNRNDIKYDIGDRAVQLIVMPYAEIKLIEVDELNQTERGQGGYGSTGK